jgi:predicted RNase H-like HicB family nuclease
MVQTAKRAADGDDLGAQQPFVECLTTTAGQTEPEQTAITRKAAETRGGQKRRSEAISAYAVICESGPNEEGQITWSACVPDLPGCVGVGDTLEECQQIIREAVELHLDYSREHGLRVPEPTSKAGMIEVAA